MKLEPKGVMVDCVSLGMGFIWDDSVSTNDGCRCPASTANSPIDIHLSRSSGGAKEDLLKSIDYIGTQIRAITLDTS